MSVPSLNHFFEPISLPEACALVVHNVPAAFGRHSLSPDALRIREGHGHCKKLEGGEVMLKQTGH